MITRIITGISLATIISLLLLIGNTSIFSAFFYLAILACTIEWGNVNGIKYFGLAFNLFYIILAVIYLLYISYDYNNINIANNLIETITRFFIYITPIWILIFKRILFLKNNKFSKAFLYFSGFFIFLNFTAAVLDIKFNLTNQVSEEYINFLRYPLLTTYKSGIILLSVIFLTALNDTGAYFFGKFFGKHKLAPAISPNKTIEGLIGGIITSIIFSIFLYYYLFNVRIGIIYWVLIVFALMIFANLGDLVESKLKRVVNIKDSGNILPGHGGMLDRLDSHFVVIPAFWFCMLNIIL